MPFARRLAVLFVPVGLCAQELRPTPAYGSSLLFGTGLVNIPVAWVSPSTGDLFASVSARAIGAGSLAPKATGSVWDLTESLELHLAGRLSLGGSLYSTTHAAFGGFAKLLVVKQPSEGERWIPSIAVGVRNLGSSAYEDRFATGDRRVADVLPDSGHAKGLGKINGSPSAYVVMTRDYLFQDKSASLSLGYGNGLFANNGGLDTVYNKRGTIVKGLFIGGRVVVPSGRLSTITFMAENDGWDWNAGALVTFAHVSVGLYLTELEESKGVPDNKPVANFTKVALLFSYNASLPDIIRGSQQRAEAAEAQIETKRLIQEIAQRTVRMTEMQAQMAKAQQGADKAAAAELEALQKRLEAERDAMKKASDRLDQLQKVGKPPAGGPR
jgi:hypothetical protein